MESRPQRVDRRRVAPLDARDGSRARARAPRRSEAPRRAGHRHAERFLGLALAAEPELAGPIRRVARSTRASSSTTSARHSTGCSPRAASKTRCAPPRPSSRSGGRTPTSARPAAGSRWVSGSRDDVPAEVRAAPFADSGAYRPPPERLGGRRTMFAEARDLYRVRGLNRDEVLVLCVPQLLRDARRRDRPRRGVRARGGGDRREASTTIAHAGGAHCLGRRLLGTRPARARR